MRRIALISTGGTIEKTYDELSGVLHNEVSILDIMLARLDLRGVDIERLQLMNKDSMEMSEQDHTLIAATACRATHTHDGVVVVHGTDTLSETGEKMLVVAEEIEKPIVLTGAMRPYALRNTDAIQNLTEALLAVQVVDPGVYVAMHNNVLAFPGVIKDREHGTFVKS
ncbi:MAG: asparaginase [Myxococcales bacterium]|nr:asparaginase [Myxococcales bacterium]